MAKVTEWLKTLKLESYSDAFAEFGYDTLVSQSYNPLGKAP